MFIQQITNECFGAASHSFILFVKPQWIARQLRVLQMRINNANEKGWRDEYPF